MFARRRAREPVLLAQDFSALLGWYEAALGFSRVQVFDGAYRYALVQGPGGVRLGIAEAAPLGLRAPPPGGSAVRLQWEIENLPAFFDWFETQAEAHGGAVAFGPQRDAADGFVFGAIRDLEGNEIWLVDETCP